MLKKSENANVNYLAKIVKLGAFEPIKGSDFLCTTKVYGAVVVVNKTTCKEGDLMIYFTPESQIAKWYLKKNNLFSKSEYNDNPEKKGYFEITGRVRCVKLRGVISEGLLMPINTLSDSISEAFIGADFDIYCDELFVSKYIPPTSTKVHHAGKVGESKKKKFSKATDSQFEFHKDTSNLKNNITILQPEREVYITRKIHGTSAISSYVLCGVETTKSVKITNWISNKILYPILNFFGNCNGSSEILTRRYDYLYSSRKVIKNDKEPDAGFYKEDVWKDADDIVRSHLCKGMTMYYEIAGYTKTGQMIQKGYTYGCVPPEDGKYEEGVHFKIYIYRITLTNYDGVVFEFTPTQINQYCEKHDLRPVPYIDKGRLSDITQLNCDDQDKWPEEMYDLLSKSYLEKKADDCGGNPDEGVVIRFTDTINWCVYKLKSRAFLLKETVLLDAGEVGMEE